MQVGEGLRKVTVYLVNGEKYEFDENDMKDEMVATVQAGMYVVGDRVKVVQTANGYFRDSPDKNKNVVTGPPQAMIFERMVFGVNNVLRVEFEMDEIGYDAGLITLNH
jgi:hypothetical protein